jgi:hypothetical protein
LLRQRKASAREHDSDRSGSDCFLHDGHLLMASSMNLYWAAPRWTQVKVWT